MVVCLAIENMIKYIGTIFLIVLYLDDSCARRYHTLVKSEFPLDDIEQTDRSGSLYRIPLITKEEYDTAPNPDFGLKVIKVNKRPVASESKASSNVQIGSHKDADEDISRKPKVYHYTYTIPEQPTAETHETKSDSSRDKNKHIAGEEDFILPKQERKQSFYSAPAQEKDDKPQTIDVSNTAIVSSTKGQVNKAKSKSKPTISTATSSSQSSDIEFSKVQDANVNLKENLLNLPKVNNYKLVKDINQHYLETDVMAYPYYYPAADLYDLAPKIFNIHYDSRYWQNAPITHSFIYSHPVEIDGNFGQRIPPQHGVFAQPTLIYQAPVSHAFQELNLKEPVKFRPDTQTESTTTKSDLTDEEIEKYFLPKKVIGVAFGKIPNVHSELPAQHYELPDVRRYIRYLPACGSNCYPYATKFEFGVPILEVPKLPSSYDVPLY